MIDVGLLRARRLVALFWKNMQVPSVKTWLKEIATCLAVERLAYIVRGKRKQFLKVWNMEYLEDENVTVTWTSSLLLFLLFLCFYLLLLPLYYLYYYFHFPFFSPLLVLHTQKHSECWDVLWLHREIQNNSKKRLNQSKVCLAL